MTSRLNPFTTRTYDLVKPLVEVATVVQEGIDPTLAELVKIRASQIIRTGLIDGLPGFVTLESDGLPQTTALEIVDGKIVGIYIVRNPDKLRHLEAGTVH